ncbi:MAG: c-type cytochrome biogenesis protein CcmI [Gammaproteobacteria bacterium]|nr:c-type cytochrome biogenesis protein CcmI [Gammaproteobacteria bacterium]
MNITFWVLMILMLLVAIGILVYPLLKARQYSPLAYKDSNLKINDEKIKELDVDLKEGRIDQHYYKAAREELDRELLIDIPMESKETAAEHYVNTARRHPALASLISVFVPMLALLLYLDLGMHNASDELVVENQKQAAAQSTQQPSVEEMASKLEAHIEKNGGTAQEWTMLGRAHKYLGRYDLAAKAFTVALDTDTNNAQLMLESAEILALNNNREFTPEARELVLKAYALEPDNVNALWFAGVAEYQYGNYRQAIQHLTRMLPLAGKDEGVVKSVVSVIAESREKLVAAGNEMPELETLLGVKANSMAVAPSAAEDKTSVETGQTSLRVMVDISTEARGKFNASDLVFVYAKAKRGPRMPLAAHRLTLADLPVTVVLDDSMAMVEGMNLSAFSQLVVSARVTKSGAAIAQSGDYLGHVDVENKSAAVLEVVIDTIVP